MKKSLGLLILGLLGLSLTSCISGEVYADADKYLAGDQTYEENITSLDIDWVSGTLTLVEDENIDGVKIVEDTNLTRESELVHSYLHDGKLNIHFFASGHTSFGMKIRKDLTVTYHPGLSNLKVDITSGTFNAETLTADKVSIDMTSGSSNIGSIISQEVDVDFTSGNLKIGRVSTNGFDAELTSGKLNVQHITANSFNVDMTSGDMKVGFDEISKASFEITSGSIDMSLPEAGGKVRVNKTSGSVKTERQCSVSDNLYTFDEGSADIKVEMTSGKLTIR